MRRLIARWLVRPLEAVSAALLVTLLGVYGAVHLSVDLFPNLDVPVVQVISHMPAASAEDLELLVTRPIEGAMRSAPGIRRVASTTMQGVSITTVQFAWGTSVRDARQVVLGRVGLVRSKLPAGVQPRLEHIGTTLDEVGGWAVYGGGDPVETTAIVRRDVVARLMTVPGVSLVDVIGGERRAFWVEIRPERLADLGLTLRDVEAAIRRTHGAAVAGFMPRAGEDVVVRVDSRLLQPEDLAAVPLPLPDGSRVTLAQVANVREGRAPRHSQVRANGVPAVALFVRKQPGASTITVMRDVRSELERAQSMFPAGTRIVPFYDQSEVLVEARRAIIGDLLIGMLLAVGVLWFFLGSARPTIAVALTIPLSLLATLMVLWIGGQTLNVITLAALTLAVGMIVDDAIVVTENISRHREAGAEPRQAAIDGATEIAAADAAGTFTTVAAFAPLLMVGGLAAVFLRPFGLTISAALLASLVLSLTLVPAILGQGGRGRSRAGQGRAGQIHGGHRVGDRTIAFLDRRLQRGLAWTVGHRRSTLVIAVLVVLAMVSALGLRHGAISVLPPVDEGALLVEYVLPPGVSLDESLRVGGELAQRARALPGALNVEVRVGAPEGGASVEGVNRGELRLLLASRDSGRPSAEALLEQLGAASSDLEGVILLLHQPTRERMEEAFSGLPAVFGVTIIGPDLATLEAIASDVETVLESDPAVHNIINNAGFHRPQLDIKIDGTRCAALGVDPADVRQTVAAALWGDEVLRVVRGREEVSILLRVESFGHSLGKVKTLFVPTRTGETVPLERVATFELHRVPAQIDRLNGQRQLTVLAEVDGNLLAVARRLDTTFASMDLPNGYGVACTGRYRVLGDMLVELTLVLAIAALLILAILTWEFGSVREAVWILAVVPVSVGGAAVGLALTGSGLSVAVATGLLTLLGIGVNNGIVLTDFAQRGRVAGMPRVEAVTAAARARLRPILATTLTTIAGLLPTALALGSGQHVFQPFAITVIFGLAVGTVATLLVLPAALLRGEKKTAGD